jgi:hypothetical protein
MILVEPIAVVKGAVSIVDDALFFPPDAPSSRCAALSLCVRIGLLLAATNWPGSTESEALIRQGASGPA